VVTRQVHGLAALEALERCGVGRQRDVRDRDGQAEPDGGEVAEVAPKEPAVPLKRSITPDFLICLEDGRKFKSLKRHLRTKYNMSPEEYRAKWGLPKDYPMVAPNYAKARSDLAKQMGLGQGGRQAPRRRGKA
jgi:predicted transcriptional regulator